MQDEVKVKTATTPDAYRITVDVGSGDYETRAAWRYNADGTVTLIAIRTVKSAIKGAGGSDAG